ncbi:MAG: Ig-like domain-containing protein [Candidatus Aminicenantes bacterium]|nr:Ig-like domain-containing protein [Candidatus Aminicenantes bacterium]
MSKIAIVIMLLAVFFAAAANGIQAADLYVTATADQVPGSLRAAITTANSNGENDAIHLPAGLYLLKGTADEDGNIGGDLDIDNGQAITILGEGVKNTFIDGNHLDRVIHILSGTVSISGVTIQNGKTGDGDDEGEKGGYGGGVYNCGKLNLTDSSIVDNRCGTGYKGYYYPGHIGCPGSGGDGGGIYNIGTLTLTRCTIKNNLAGQCGRSFYDCPGTHGGHGGGIYNGSAGSQKLLNCTISNNGSGDGYGEGWDEDDSNNGGEGGGIYNSGSQELINCRINGNHTGIGYSGRCGYGGGIYNSGSSIIKNSFIINNTTYNEENEENDYLSLKGNGGGIYNSGSLTITDGTIDRNSTAHGGSGAGIHHQGGTVTLIRCSITNNSSGDGVTYYLYNPQQGGNGGGIFNNSTMKLTNCTVGGNTTGTGVVVNYHPTGGNGGDGAGICNSGSLTLGNSTVCQNLTGAGGMGADKKGRPGNGGGICNLSGTVQLKNTIVANNAAATGGESEDAWGTLSSNGYNLIENTTDCTITGILTGNITGVDPLLGPLAKNGGPTQTYALLPGSPAIDAGNSSGISTDQRGYTRPVDIAGIPNVSDGSDIGAYELEYVNLITISGTITYGGKGLAGATLTFSNQGGTTAADDDGNYSQAISSGWTGTVTPSLPNYVFTPTSRSYTNVTAAQQGQDYSAAAIDPPRIALDRTQLNFGADVAGRQTGMQTLTIANSGGGLLTWSISDKAQWLNYTPTSGAGPATVTVTVDPTGLSAGTYTSAILVESPTAANSPKAVPVTLTVYNADAVNPPFGSFDTPLEGATVTGSIPVSGWAIDDIGIESVKIYRSPVESEGSDWIYIGDAIRVDGARPDIETLYPVYPENYKTGWGYMLLTHSLPNGGNGAYTLFTKATDMEGNEVTLGSKTITIDNAHAFKPFGAIDTPIQGGTASGKNYVNYGWALTPQPNAIPFDGSTIDVVIDGVVKGNPVYNVYRSDIATLFPGYANSDGAGGYYYIDTTKLKNGLHTIAWIVSDSGGNSDGIGSRYFSVLNTGAGEKGRAEKDESRRGEPPCSPVFDPCSPVFDLCSRSLTFDEIITVEIKELERVEINLSAEGVFEGYLIVGDQLRELPIGSTLDTDRGIFYWQPGPGFVGEYCLVFIGIDDDGRDTRKNVIVNIKPKQ